MRIRTVVLDVLPAEGLKHLERRDPRLPFPNNLGIPKPEPTFFFRGEVSYDSSIVLLCVPRYLRRRILITVLQNCLRLASPKKGGYTDV